jgi:DMSO/TMAO reductase YedYZ molybdopterin-dependent catalytic subunit
MELHEHEIPIACVEGWSPNASWRGVRMRDLLAAAGIDEPHEVDVVSLQEESAPGRASTKRNGSRRWS